MIVPHFSFYSYRCTSSPLECYTGIWERGKERKKKERWQQWLRRGKRRVDRTSCPIPGSVKAVYCHSAYLTYMQSECKRAKLLQSCLTLCDPMDCGPPGSSVHGNSPGKNTGVDFCALLQGIFLTQGSNQHLLCLLHWQVGFIHEPDCLGSSLASPFYICVALVNLPIWASVPSLIEEK